MSRQAPTVSRSYTPDVCTCLHHSCRRTPNHYGLCPLCEAMECEAPDERRQPTTPAPAPRSWPRAIPCSVCGGPYHEALGHLEVRVTDHAMLVKHYCWRCTLELIETIKQYDWSQVPKGLRRSAWLLFRGRPLVKPPKVTAIL
jgi:hypothetical protein